MASPRSHNALRRSLIVSTALVGGVVGIGHVARAQDVPNPAGATFSTSGTSGGAANANNPTFLNTPVTGGTIEAVYLHDNKTVINWTNNFSVQQGSAIEFRDRRSDVPGITGTTQNIAVLNRDLSGIQSSILGTLTSDPNVAVYLINRSGILFGANSVVSTGSFFAAANNTLASASDPQGNSDFLNGNPLRYGIAGTGGVRVLDGAQIGTTGNFKTDGGRLGDLVLLGISVDVGAAQLTATRGDVALVAAEDVTVATGVGSPLSLTINRGTAVSGALKVRGTIAGQHVTMALATRGSVADAVLSVGGMVTANGALPTENGIVLTADASSSGSMLGYAPSPAQGSIAVTGTLGTTAGVSLTAAQGISTASATTASGGAITASGGGAMSFAALTAGGPIAIGGDGAKTFNGTLTTTGSGAISVDGNASAVFTAPVSIKSGGSVLLGQTTALDSFNAQQITAVNDVRVRAVQGGMVSGVNAGGFARFDATVGGVTLGAVQTGGDLIVNAGGASAVTGAATIGGNYTVTAGALTLGSTATPAIQSAAGAVTLTTTGSDLNAIGALTLQGNSDGVGGEALTLSSAGSIGFGPNTVLLAGTTRQSDVQIRSVGGGAVSLGRVDARALLGAVGAATPFTNGLTRATALSLGDVTLSNPLALTGSAVAVGKVVTPGDVTLTVNGAGALSSGAIASGGAFVATTGGAATVGTAGDTIKAVSVNVTGGSVVTRGTIQTGALSLHATTADLSVNGPSLSADSVSILADAGTATVAGGVTTIGDYTVSGRGVVLGATGGTVLQQARGGIAIRATGTLGIVGLGSLTLLSNSDSTFANVNARGIALTANAGNIAFAPTTVLNASTVNNADVTIAAPAAGATVALGAVNARDLLGLAAQTGAVTLGNVTLGVANGLTVGTTSGDITTGTIRGYAALTFTTNAGNLTTGALTSDQGTVTGRATGTVTTGAVSGRAGVDLRAGSTLSAGDVAAAAGPATLRATTGSVTAGAVNVFGNADVAGATGITLASLKSQVGTGNLTTTTGAIQVTGDVDVAGALTFSAGGDVSAANLRGASIVGTGLSVTAGEALGRAGGVDLTATNGNIALASATANGGNLALKAQGSGSITLGTGFAVSTATLNAAGDVRADTVRANGGDVTVIAGGSVTGRAVAIPLSDVPPPFNTAYGRTSLASPVGNVTVTAGTGNTLAQLGDVTHGTGNSAAVAAGLVDVRGAGIDLTSATARVGALSLVATSTAFTLGTGSAGTTAYLQKLGAVGELVASSVSAGTQPAPALPGDVVIRSESNARLGTVATATGMIDIFAQSIVSGLALATPVNDKRSLSGYGRTTLSAPGTIKVGAASLLQLGSITGGNICLNGNGACSAPLLSTPTIDVDGTVRATGNLFAGGSDVLLGQSGTTQTMRANGSVRLVATTGAIRGGGGLTLLSDADGDGAGTDSLTLDARGAIVFASGSTLLGGVNRSADIGIRQFNAGAQLTLDAVRARSLGVVDAAGTTFGPLALTGPVVLGAVSVQNALTLTTPQGITATTIDVTNPGQGLTLGAGGAIGLGAGTANGNIAVTAGTDARIGALTVDPANTGSAANGGSIALTATTGSVTGLAIAPQATDGRPAPAFGRTELKATTTIAVSAGATAQLGAVTHGVGTTGTVLANDVDIATATIALDSATARTGQLRLNALSGPLTLGSGSAATAVTLTALGSVAVNTLSAGGAVTVQSTGTVGTGHDVTITDAVTAGGTYSVSGQNVALGVAPLLGLAPVQKAVGAVSIIAGSGTITGGAGLTLQSNSGGVADTGNVRGIVLDAATGVAFDLTSSLLAGTARQSALAITLRSAAAPLSLGTVRAGALGVTNTALIAPAVTNGDIVLGDVLTDAAIDLAAGGSVRAGSVQTVAGGVRLQAGGSVTGLAGTSTGTTATGYGRAAITAGGAASDAVVGAGALAQLGIISAGRDARVTAAEIDTSTASAGGVLNLLATARALLLDSGTAGGAATLSKQGATGDLRVGVVANPAFGLTAGGSAGISSSSNARLSFVNSGGAISIATTGGDVTGLSGGSPAGELSSAYGRANLAASGALTVNASGLVQLGTGTAGGNTAIFANTGIDATGLGAGAALSAVTQNGWLLLGSGSAGATATLTKLGAAGELRLGVIVPAGTPRTTGLTSGDTATVTSSTAARIGFITSTGGNIATAANGGDLTGLSGSVPLGELAPSYGRADLTASAAGRSITAGSFGLAQLGTARAGKDLTVTANTGIDATQLVATTGMLSATTQNGSLLLGSGSASVGASLTKSGTAGELRLAGSYDGTTQTGGLMSGGTASIASGSDARIGAASSTTGDVTVTATNGSVTGLIATTPAGTLATGYGRATLLAGRDATVTAGPVAQLGTVQAGRTALVTAGALDASVVSAGTGSVTLTAASGVARIGTASAATSATVQGTSVDATKLTATAGALGVTATNGPIRLGTGTAGTALALNANGANGAVTITTLLSSGTTTTISAGAKAIIQQATAGTDLALTATDADFNGAIKANTVKLTVADVAGGAANTLRLGDAPGGTAGFDLSAAEINQINATTLTLDAGSRAVQIGSVVLGSNVGRSRVDVLTTGAITVTGGLSAATAGRVLRLGGTATTATDRAASLRIITTPTVATGGYILADTLDLRATRISAGQQAFLDKLAAVSSTSEIDTITTQFVTNPQSLLYDAAAGGNTGYTGSANAGTAATGTAPVFLSANNLSLSYGVYALFQNTGIGTDTGGVNIGNVSGPSLALTSSGTGNSNALALFGRIGTVNGTGVATGRSAALLTGSAIGTPTLSGASTVSATNTRVNGCILGGGGCLITLASIPRLVPFDLGQSSILSAATDLALAFDPLVGTGNEALFSDLGTIDLFSSEEQACPPDSNAETCRKSGAPK